MSRLCGQCGNDDDLSIFESVWPPVAEGNNVVEKDEKAVTDGTDADLRIAGDAFVAEVVVVEQNFSKKEAAHGWIIGC